MDVSEIHIANPFRKRFGPQFFKQIPQSAGVYWLNDSKRRCIFVGHAKNLRTKLASFKYLKTESTSTREKLILAHTYDIHWSECPSKEAADILEKRLVNEYSPPINFWKNPNGKVKYFGLFWASDQLYLEISHKAELNSKFEWYGPFRGRMSTQMAFSALLRLMWLFNYQATGLNYPQPLTREIAPDFFVIEYRNFKNTNVLLGWRRLIGIFLKGESDLLIKKFKAEINLSENEAFLSIWFQRDLETLNLFFKKEPTKNKYLKEWLNSH